MLKGLFGPASLTATLRGGLEETSATHRAIAERVANALQASSSTDFASTLKAKGAGKVDEADLQRDMAALADTQIRYEADAKLLQAAYARLRAAMKRTWLARRCSRSRRGRSAICSRPLATAPRPAWRASRSSSR